MRTNSKCLRTISILCGTLLVIGALIVSVSASHAEDWPTRPIKIIVPFAAGGAVDLVAQILQDDMGKALGTTMVVENRAGGASVPASEALINAPPDGYTIAIMSSNYASNAIMQPHLSYDTIKDITPISMVVINTVMILVPADSPIHTLADLVAQAKVKPEQSAMERPASARRCILPASCFARARISTLSMCPIAAQLRH